MTKIKSIEEKKVTYCLDCSDNPESCGEDPLDCLETEEAKMYFELYNKTGSKYINI